MTKPIFDGELGDIVPMTADEAQALMATIDERDPDEAHRVADRAILGVLLSHGHDPLVRAFIAIDKWYS